MWACLALFGFEDGPPGFLPYGSLSPGLGISCPQMLFLTTQLAAGSATIFILSVLHCHTRLETLDGKAHVLFVFRP